MERPDPRRVRCTVPKRTGPVTPGSPAPGTSGRDPTATATGDRCGTTPTVTGITWCSHEGATVRAVDHRGRGRRRTTVHPPRAGRHHDARHAGRGGPLRPDRRA